MRIGYLRMWLEQFEPNKDVRYEMDCFHGLVKLKTSSNGVEYSIDLRTGECSANKQLAVEQ